MSGNTPFPGPPGSGPFNPGGPPPAAPPTGKRKDAADKKVTRRVISRQAKLAALFAIIAGALVFLVLFGSSAPTNYVAVTKEAVPALTAMSATQIEVLEAPTDLVQEGAISGANRDEVLTAAQALAATGRTVRPLARGEQLTSAMFTTDVSLQEPLKEDERLVSIRASIASAAGGAVKAGDRVDVYASASSGSAQTIAGVIVEDVEVVAIAPAETIIDGVQQEQSTPDNRGKDPAELLPETPLGGTYVLRVRDSAVAALVSVDAGGRVYLVLRGADARSPEEPYLPVTTIEAICGLAAGTLEPAIGTDRELPFACQGIGQETAPTQ